MSHTELDRGCQHWRDGTEQGELFATYRHQAIVEQLIAELKDRPLAHLPSGQYAANPRHDVAFLVADSRPGLGRRDLNPRIEIVVEG